MAVFIKYWAKVHDLTGTGKLTNYALTMMIIFYFQQPHVAILPSVVWLQRDSANDYIVDFWNTGFMCKKEFFPPTKNRANIAELLGGFFKYYSLFNFDELIVCPYLGFPIKKMVFQDLYALPNEFDRYRCNVLQGNVLPLRLNTPMCVQDPFEQSHNVASAITMRLAGDLKEYFKFTATAFEEDKNNNYAEFLKIILLQKPKLIRNKSQPEFRVNLFPRIISAIDSPDWKTVARDMIFTIFEKMLKIKLGKVEEKVNPDTMKEKEKYSGLLTKAIWKRKQLNKLYSIMNLNFQQRQERITEEILNIDQIDLNIMFQLVLTFSHEPRSVVLSLRWLSGEGEDYREFGKFFLTITQSWFMHQLRVQYGSGIDKDKNDLQESDPNESLDSDDDSPSSGEARKESEDREASPTTPSPTTPSPTTPSPTDNRKGSPSPPSSDTK
ncbi:hypothetical protein O3G_MSEX008603 [Manduca sexta]|uniref:PAP-associated domain-containing protein n=2 Tax=Manduca sexta TaxID=7130 RepID=A0A921ZCH0_MANSE|nr:hypothetical protein O3G_MSEX008603 [Manduca sexta]